MPLLLFFGGAPGVEDIADIDEDAPPSSSTTSLSASSSHQAASTAPLVDESCSCEPAAKRRAEQPAPYFSATRVAVDLQPNNLRRASSENDLQQQQQQQQQQQHRGLDAVENENGEESLDDGRELPVETVDSRVSSLLVSFFFFEQAFLKYLIVTPHRAKCF